MLNILMPLFSDLAISAAADFKLAYFKRIWMVKIYATLQLQSPLS